MPKPACEVTIDAITYRSLKDLAKAFPTIPYQTIAGRWARGDRGQRLVRPVDQSRSRRGRW